MSASLSIKQDDHVRGSPDAPVVVIEYGDFECPYCARAHAALGQLRRQHGERMTLVYRHLPLSDLHPFAQPAAEAAEAAGAQGKFWEMHDALFDNQGMQGEDTLPALAANLQLDAGRFAAELEEGRHRARVERDLRDAHALEATGTPSFFINGERYHGDSDHASLSAAIAQAMGGQG